MSEIDESKQATLRSIGMILVAVAGVAFYWWMFYDAGYGSGRNERKANVESAHYASDTANRMERECSAATGKVVRECIAKIVASERENQRDESDLAAQWRAADWVMWAGMIAGLQLLATLAGLYFIEKTLVATRKAVEGTGDATEEMRKANRLTLERNIDDSRPFICIKGITIDELRIGPNSDWLPVPSQNRVHVFASIDLSNVSSGLAVNVRCGVGLCSIFNRTKEVDFFWPAGGAIIIRGNESHLVEVSVSYPYDQVFEDSRQSFELIVKVAYSPVALAMDLTFVEFWIAGREIFRGQMQPLARQNHTDFGIFPAVTQRSQALPRHDHTSRLVDELLSERSGLNSANPSKPVPRETPLR